MADGDSATGALLRAQEHGLLGSAGDIAAQLRASGGRDSVRLVAAGHRAADDLAEALRSDLTSLAGAADRQARAQRDAGRAEGARLRAEAELLALTETAAAAADATQLRRAAAAEALALRERAAGTSQARRARAIEEADGHRARAVACAAELLAATEEQARLLIDEAAAELDDAISARRRAAERARDVFETAVAVAADLVQETAAALAEVRRAPALERAAPTPAPVLEPEGETHGTVAPGRDTVPATVAPLLVPTMTMRDELVLRGLVLAGVAATAWFWMWWLATGHGTWSAGSVVATLLLAWPFSLTAYYYFFICRMTRPNPAVPVPDLRAAMVVTKAPSEPWALVRTTLEAMLVQEHPRPYDVWLADERVADETRRWCEEHGVQISTREGVEEYHQPTWPRRTRSKEGNLAYFYDRVGYDRYDVVAQLDADHVPSPHYLTEITRPFADPRVGYVAAPSICDANEEAGWTVRGRLFREAFVHGPVQAGCNQGFAPVCIGSHYAVRTAALRDVGGIGPELAEDYSTTLWLQSGGWDGVFSIDAEAHGDGPESLDEMLLQEVQWSRSLGTILTKWAPERLRTVPWRARLRLAFAALFYPLQGLVLLTGALLPAVCVLLETSWGRTSLLGFYVHMWPTALVGMATGAYLRRSGLLRPRRAKLWSWELMLFQLVRWPWALLGCAQGMYAGLRSRVVAFKVTPKGGAGLKALRPQSVVPTLALGLLGTMVAVLVRDPGPAIGFQILAGLQGVIYLLVATVVVLLHLAANRRRSRSLGQGSSWLDWANGGAAAALTAVVVTTALAALLWRIGGLAS